VVGNIDQDGPRDIDSSSGSERNWQCAGHLYCKSPLP
jgi:hypothetical protein